ncbi:MAG: nuclear transport factor 2 family protein [Deltaproteobacteria bacterium]|nr:nuclear transport factor 2 family protein [Deltaproteobacteria bacterium]
MPDVPSPHQVVDRYFQAMRAGSAAEHELMALFAEDARYTEPFTGQARTHEGQAAIRRCFVDAWRNPPVDLELVVDRVDVDGDRVQARWTCHSPSFPGPVSGRDAYVIRDGKIAQLVVTFAEPS